MFKKCLLSNFKSVYFFSVVRNIFFIKNNDYKFHSISQTKLVNKCKTFLTCSNFNNMLTSYIYIEKMNYRHIKVLFIKKITLLNFPKKNIIKIHHKIRQLSYFLVKVHFLPFIQNL